MARRVEDGPLVYVEIVGIKGKPFCQIDLAPVIKVPVLVLFA
jgi:hypothetical protein